MALCSGQSVSVRLHNIGLQSSLTVFRRDHRAIPPTILFLIQVSLAKRRGHISSSFLTTKPVGVIVFLRGFGRSWDPRGNVVRNEALGCLRGWR